MIAFLDLQGFRGDDETFIPKEVAIISEDGYEFAHFLLKPPYLVQSLSSCRRSEVLYMENHFHGIAWQSGQINFEDFQTELIHLSKNFKTIYIKGDEKRKVLSFLEKSVINLEDLGCPSLAKLKQKFVAVQCLNHNIEPPVCAIENMIILSEWYKRQNEYG
ncbi:hypothetical protein ILUMI_17480 [Ignelater luminosus]|uniref:Uncharacterized protein n=1 Tax=Ignelater luminosus TaxID=2038154 RepID=A0A8K0CLM6_IGNLU|nr:hypothetical protein ILUMI_17480 [Ignelater luminosus]